MRHGTPVGGPAQGFAVRADGQHAIHPATLLEALRAAAHLADEFMRPLGVAIRRRGQLVMYGQAHNSFTMLTLAVGQIQSKANIIFAPFVSHGLRVKRNFCKAFVPLCGLKARNMTAQGKASLRATPWVNQPPMPKALGETKSAQGQTQSQMKIVPPFPGLRSFVHRYPGRRSPSRFALGCHGMALSARQ